MTFLQKVKAAQLALKPAFAAMRLLVAIEMARVPKSFATSIADKVLSLIVDQSLMTLHVTTHLKSRRTTTASVLTLRVIRRRRSSSLADTLPLRTHTRVAVDGASADAVTALASAGMNFTPTINGLTTTAAVDCAKKGATHTTQSKTVKVHKRHLGHRVWAESVSKGWSGNAVNRCGEISFCQSRKLTPSLRPQTIFGTKQRGELSLGGEL